MGKLSRELRMGIHNRFDIEVVDVETGEIKQKAQAFNVVCNSFFTSIYRTTATNIQFGSGTGTPSATDTALFHYEGVTNTNGGSDTLDYSREKDGIWVRVLKRRILNTEYVGVSISEIGLATSSSGSTLVTHAMLQDMNGNPITIAHTSTDIINVYCSVYLHYDGQHSDIKLYGHVNGPYPRQGIFKWLLGNVNTENSYYETGDYPCLFTGKGVPACTMSKHSQSTWYYPMFKINVSATDNVVKYTSAQIPTDQKNYNGIHFLGICESGLMDTASPTFEKLTNVLIEVGGTTIPPFAITGESVGVGDGATTKFKTKYFMPYNAKVYVNNVEQTSGVTVKKLGNASITAGTEGAVQCCGDTGYRDIAYLIPRHPDDLEFIMPPIYTANFGQASIYPQQYSYNLRYNSVIECLIPEVGLYNVYADNGTVKGSNDGVTWYDVSTSRTNSQMDQSGAHYRYYKYVGTSNYAYVYFNAYDGYNIIFDNPPAQGDVITIDYTTDYIPKDSDHVLDVELTFTFGEWQGN